MKLLMHICCSNCCIYPLQSFLLKEIDIRGFWYNPNIHPYTEYSARLDSLKKLQSLWGLDIEYLDDYELDYFLKSVAGRGANRCAVCYSIRLEKTAETAKKMNLRGFTTSLFASPYQKFDMIITLGNEIAKRHGIEFYWEDQRKGWSVSRDLSQELGLYRQKYCGCIYSEMERYSKKDRKRKTPGSA